MAVAFRDAAGVADVTSTTNCTATKPAGVVEGDLMIAAHVSDSDGTLAAMTAPAGWTLIEDETVASGLFLKVWTKTASGSEPADYTFPDSTSADASAGIVALSGQYRVTPISSGPTTTPSTTDATGHVAPSQTGIVGGMLVTIHAGGTTGTNAARTYTAPGGMTERVDTNGAASGWVCLGMFTEALASASATGTRSATCSAAVRSASVSLVVAPEPPADVTATATAGATAAAARGDVGDVTATTTAGATATAAALADVSAATTAAVTATAISSGAALAVTTSAATATATKSDTASATAASTAAVTTAAVRGDTGAVSATPTTAAASATAVRVGFANVTAASVASATTVEAEEERPGFGQIYIGRLVLTESYGGSSESWNGAARVLTLSGQETSPLLTLAEVAAVQDDLLGMTGTMVPVRFTYKQDRDGYYTITDVTAELTNWQDEAVIVEWKMTLTREGAGSEVDIEARLGGPATRTNAHSVTGDRWHSPPVGHSGYWVRGPAPTVLNRDGEDGTATIYRGLPVGVSPRYECPVVAYQAGRARFLDADGIERCGTRFAAPATGWTLSNGLVKVTEAAGVFTVSAWDTGAWADTTWQLTAGSALAAPAECTVLRNDVEYVQIRLLWSGSPGRTTCDLTLRRGSRFVELYLRTPVATTLRVARDTAEAGTSATGYLRATSNDAAGNRYVIGSAGAFTPDTTNGRITVTSATTLDAFIGVELGGSSAVSGDQAAQLLAQYCGSPSEAVKASRR